MANIVPEGEHSAQRHQTAATSQCLSMIATMKTKSAQWRILSYAKQN